MRTTFNPNLSGIHRELDDAYEQKRMLIAAIEGTAQREGAFSWRFIPGIWENAVRRAGHARRA